MNDFAPELPLENEEAKFSIAGHMFVGRLDHEFRKKSTFYFTNSNQECEKKESKFIIRIKVANKFVNVAQEGFDLSRYALKRVRVAESHFEVTFEDNPKYPMYTDITLRGTI